MHIYVIGSLRALSPLPVEKASSPAMAYFRIAFLAMLAAVALFTLIAMVGTRSKGQAGQTAGRRDRVICYCKKCKEDARIARNIKPGGE